MNEPVANPSVSAMIGAVRGALKREGVRPALRLLNSFSQHRFTAVFRFDGPLLRNLYLVDRHDTTIERSPDLPVLESYCLYVRRIERTFITEDSLHDDRVAGHPKVSSVQSYCGIPLMTPEGSLFGTICHFDYEPFPFSTEEVIVLEDVASDLVAALEAEAGHSSPLAS